MKHLQDKKFNERKSFFIIANNISLKREKLPVKGSKLPLQCVTIVSGNQINKISS